MDANQTAGVFSNTGTGYQLDYWNILGHGVEGRYTFTGVPIIDTTNTISSETEPNDTQATANGPIGLQPVTGEQTGHFDQDWFYFDVLQPGAINIHLEKQGWPMILAVYDSQLNQLDYDDEGNGSRTLWNVAVSPGRYYIEISPREQHSSNIAYTLQLEELNPTYYYFKDHLGSTRVVVNATGTILDATDYYPFGLAMPGRSHTTAPGTKEGFTGHERDHEVGLDYMVARRYDPALGRFLGVDPLSEVYPNWTPYHYVLNNPVINLDPTGEYVVRGTRVTRVTKGMARAFNLASVSVAGAPAAIGGRYIIDDPSFRNSGMDWASLAGGGIFKTAGRTISGLRGFSAADLRMARTSVDHLPSAFLGGVAALANSFGDALVGNEETFNNLTIDEAIFEAAVGLTAPDGSPLGELNSFGDVFSVNDNAIGQFEGGKREVTNRLNEVFNSLDKAARDIIKDNRLDLRDSIDVERLVKMLDRLVREEINQ